MTKLLFTTKLAGNTIRVVEDTEVEPYAAFDPDTNTIHLHPSLKEDRHLLESTVKHELMHAVFFVTGVHAMLSDDLQEVIICLMDSFFYDAADKAMHQIDLMAQKEATK